MFTLSEFNLAREKCPDDMRELFEAVNITFPGWEKITLNPQEWDREITWQVCEAMESPTISEGYARLLNAANIPYRIGNPDEMLAAVIAHKTQILSAIVSPVSEILNQVCYLVSEVDKKSDFYVFLKGHPKLRAIINNLKRACSNYISRLNKPLMTEDDAVKMFELLEQLHAVKARI